MTPEEFKAIRKSMRKTQFEMSEYIGKSLRTVQSYEWGEHKIPLCIELLLREIKNV